MVEDDSDLENRVLRIVAEVLSRTPDDISATASLRNDLHVDSLQQMTLFIVLEDEFARTIPPEEVADLDTVKDIVEFIRGKIRNTSTA